MLMVMVITFLAESNKMFVIITFIKINFTDNFEFYLGIILAKPVSECKNGLHRCTFKKL